MATPQADGLRVLITCEAQVFDGMLAFYTETLGFEIEHQLSDDSGKMAGLRRDGSRLVIATPSVMDIGASSPTTQSTLILMHPDVAAHRQVLETRYKGAIGPLREMGKGRFYALEDPSGNSVWIMQVE